MAPGGMQICLEKNFSSGCVTKVGDRIAEQGKQLSD